MKILDRVPVSDRPHLLTVHGDVVQVYRNQIIVWVGIANPSRWLPLLGLRAILSNRLELVVG